MKKIIRIVVIGIFLVFILSGLSLFILAKLHHQSVHKELVAVLNQELHGKVEFTDFQISYLRNFPHMHLGIKNLTFKNSNQGKSNLGSLDIYLNLKDLWVDQISVERIVVKSAFIHNEIDSLGNKPAFFSSNKKSKGQSKSSINFESHDIEIFDFQIYMGNKVKGNQMLVTIEKGLLSLSVGDSTTTISGQISAHLDTLISNNSLLAYDQSAVLEDVLFEIDHATNIKELKKGVILAEGIKLIPKIKFSPHEEGQMVDLHIEGEDEFDSFLTLAESQIGIGLKQVNPEARLKISYNQQGLVTPFLRPYSEVDFEVMESAFEGDQIPYPVKHFSIKGNLNNGESHSPASTVLVIDTLHAEIHESYVHGRFKLTNLDDPFVDAHLISEIDLNHVFSESENQELTGSISADIFIDGKISELEKIHLDGKQIAKGKINVEDLDLFLKNEDLRLKIASASSQLNNHIFEVTTLNGSLNGSYFNIAGKFDNLDQYLIRENEKLKGTISLNFETLDLTELLTKKEREVKDTLSELSIPKISLEIDVSGKQIVSEFGPIKNVRLNSSINYNHIEINSLKFSYQDGIVSGSGGIYTHDEQIDSIYALISGEFNYLEMDKIFKKPIHKAADDSLNLPINIINANLNLDINKGTFNEIVFDNAILTAKIKNSSISISELSVDAFGSRSSISGNLRFKDNQLAEITGISNINVAKLDLNKFEFASSKQNSGFSFNNFPEQIDMLFSLSAGEIIYEDQQLSNIKSTIDFKDQDLNINTFKADLPFGSLDIDMLVKQIRNDNREYYGKINLDIDTLNMNKLLASELLGVPSTTPGTQYFPVKSKDQTAFDPFSNTIEVVMHTQAEQISYLNGEINNLDMLVEYASDRMNLERLNFSFGDGQISSHGYIWKDEKNLYPAFMSSKADSIDIKNLLNSFNNLNQDVFTSENSQGSISWNSNLYFNLNESFFPITQASIWNFELSIHDATFYKIEPLEKALFFVGYEAKDYFIVSDLEVEALLFNNHLYFKDVFMNDNIANLDLYGVIDFTDSIIDIGTEVSLSDLLFRSKKKRILQTQRGEVHLDDDLKIFLKMEGPLKKHKIKLSKKRKFNRQRSKLNKQINRAQVALRNKMIFSVPPEAILSRK